ncbi:Cobalamin synthesis protein cobW/p47k family protein [Beijerinckiaceae bacterium RH AL1]|nr:GTP-binding protein [Beijerinckiaceae bacterium]VVB47467.1 Cobalamin synthesis protein cobW/p47k family protein [Beijerinckiaceae bacterium RH CH11]VVB47548.1 Cobalamin synthesis protein cobW/p47k family protein [Beijerinckiaceae bacterium RH AL8]VVC55903.1 Cobalamin synthesis protein cobW/p47k family protein [Beijerinckiaceae bacterium RH AL1]
MPADATSPPGHARRPPPPFDLVVVTGFLGAGKTTLLNRLLRDSALSDTLVLINEFGSVGLDHHLVERVDGDMLVMTSGCLCCSIRGDLVATLEDALRARDNGRMSPFTRVLIETTGLADPAPVLHTVMAHPYLRMRFRLQAVVTLVDAVVGDATLDAHQEAVKQVAMADRLILSKADLAGDTAHLEARLRRLNPGAPLFRADKASVADLLRGVSYDPVARGADAKAWLAAEALEQAPDHHHHDVNRHDARIRAFSLRWPRPVAPAALSLFLDLLVSAHGARLLRCKGLVALTDDPARPAVVHAVQHVVHPLQRLESWPDYDHATRLVFIVQDLDEAFVAGLWSAAAGEPGIDRADPGAPNPLAPAPGGLLA